jgi:hypothetical protein
MDLLGYPVGYRMRSGMKIVNGTFVNMYKEAAVAYFDVITIPSLVSSKRA